MIKENTTMKLGELISRCEKLLRLYGDDKIVYDFGYMFPTEIDSWRGSYRELALNYTEEGAELNLSDFISMLKNCIGKKFTGYKGGEFKMKEETYVFVANYSNSGNTGVIDVDYADYNYIITTAYCGY